MASRVTAEKVGSHPGSTAAIPHPCSMAYLATMKRRRASVEVRSKEVWPRVGSAKSFWS